MRSLLVLAAALALPAADLPLGLVEQADAQQVLVRFDPATRLAAGSMVALYGPGSVVKHPLTKKVVTENRRLLAKAQILGPDGERLRLRVLWRAEGATPEAGWDAVPLPGEAAPNGPPAATAEIKPISAPAGASVRISVPVADPDADRLLCTWTLDGAAGRCGRLDADATTTPEVTWTAPGFQPEGGITLRGVIRDPWGQECRVAVPLTLAAASEPARRAWKVAGVAGAGQEPSLKALKADPDGSCVGIDADGSRIWRLPPGQLLPQPVAFAQDQAPRRPVAVASARGELHVLDGTSVLVYGADAKLRRTLAIGREAEDLAVARDGTVAVAEADGVHLYDAQGRYRARAGRVSADDGFAQRPHRVCFTDDGVLCCLDASARRVLRFDAQLARLDAWTVVGDPNVRPVDLAPHPRGLAVLMADGQVQLYGAKGTAGETWKSAAASGLVEGLTEAAALAVDAAGTTLVTWPRSGVLARHTLAGLCTGVRGSLLRKNLVHWQADGQGRLIGLDADYALAVVHDEAGFRIARLGGKAKAGGPFSGVETMAVVPDGSGLAVIDPDKYALVRLDPRGAAITSGSKGENNGQFQDPIAVACDDHGRMYVLDQDLYRVSVFDAKGQFQFAFGTKGKGADQLYEPKLVAAALSGEAVYVYDEYNYEIKKFAVDHAGKSAKHQANGGGKGSDPGQFREPVVLAADRLGLLHVLDTSRGDWQVLDFRGAGLQMVSAKKTEELGLKGADGLAVCPDGQVWLVGGNAAIWLRW